MKPFLFVALSLLLSLPISAQLKKGDRAPAIAAKDVDGKVFNSAQYKGKYLLIDVWASWCGPCLKAFKELKVVYKNAPKDKFELIGVSIDNSSQTWVSSFIKHELPWPQYHSPGNFKSPMVEAWGVQMLPATFLINPQGLIELIDPSPKDVQKFLSKLK